MVDLAVLARRLRQHGQLLRLRDPQPRIAQLIGMVGLHRLDAVRLEPAALHGA
jgi:anti-anti-sigma regulatory factor